ARRWSVGPRPARLRSAAGAALRAAAEDVPRRLGARPGPFARRGARRGPRLPGGRQGARAGPSRQRDRGSRAAPRTSAYSVGERDPRGYEAARAGHRTGLILAL